VDLGRLARPGRAGLSQRRGAGGDGAWAAEVLAALHRVEARFGRVRAEANAPRTLDLDLIAHGRAVLDGAVVVPHPRAHERLFVMGPLAQIAPTGATRSADERRRTWRRAGTSRWEAAHTLAHAAIRITCAWDEGVPPRRPPRVRTLPNFNSPPDQGGRIVRAKSC
jgi:hypothetical protein